MIGSLQMLRGVAASLVVGFHLQAAARNEGFDPGLFAMFQQGEAGVDVFFVLSGFVIFHAASASPSLTARRFLLQRFWRIVPPYWSVLALTLVALFALSMLRGSSDDVPSATKLLSSVLLWPWPDQVMAVAWTLTIEILFYLLFATTWFRLGSKGAVVALILWSGVAQAAKFWPDGVPMALALPLYSGVIEFLMGGLIARAIAAHERRSARTAMLAGLLGLALVVPGVVSLDWGREWVAGLPAAALVYGLAAQRSAAPGWALLWGEASYLLYLSHLLVFSITGTVLRMAGVQPYQSAVGLILLFGLATAVAIAGTLLVERPYRRWTKTRS